MKELPDTEEEKELPNTEEECAVVKEMQPVKGAEMERSLPVKGADSETIQKIGFVCDGGMGSSAMGAAVFRRTLAEHHLTGIRVEVFAADLVEEGLDLIVCQEDFFRVMPDELKKTDIYTVTSFLKAEEYEELIEEIEKSRGSLI